MSIKIGINGFGRIGRNTLRAALQNGTFNEVDYVAINDPGLKPEQAAFLLVHDSVMGTLKADVKAEADGISVNGKKIKFYSEKTLPLFLGKRSALRLLLNQQVSLPMQILQRNI